MISFLDKTVGVTFGRGSIYISRIPGDNRMDLVFEEVEEGAMGLEYEISRSAPPPIDWEDGTSRVCLTFENLEGARQLLLAIEELIDDMTKRDLERLPEI